MTDRPPTGEPFSISDRASSSAELERAYRRLVACYPRSFRSGSTEEIIAVLLATAREGQRRPSVAEASDLLRGAVRMRLGLSRCPRTVLHAVRLMYLGALAEVVTLVTVLFSAGSIQSITRTAVLRGVGPHANPGVTRQLLASAASTVNVTILVDVVVALVAIAGWLFLAWANGKGYALARVASIIACALYTTLTLQGFMQGDASYSPVPPLAASSAVLAIGIATVVLLLMKQSWPYYAQPAPARQPSVTS
jgi:hypothetical protein